jgi:hypothetical protein
MNSIVYKTRIIALNCAGLAILIFCALPAQAQFVPYGGFYPDMGVIGAATAAFSSAAQQNVYMQNRQLQQTTSAARSQAWQNINRSMQMEASARSAAVPDAGQAARDWMYQNAQSSRTALRPMTLPSTDMAMVTPTREASQPAATREIMLWPTLLKEQRFNDDRADVEAPFRRAYADGKPLTIADYQGIIKSVEKMKATVKGMESQIVEPEYTAVEKFLDDLIADAQKRIQAREGAEKSE